MVTPGELISWSSCINRFILSCIQKDTNILLTLSSGSIVVPLDSIASCYGDDSSRKLANGMNKHSFSGHHSQSHLYMIIIVTIRFVNTAAAITGTEIQ